MGKKNVELKPVRPHHRLHHQRMAPPSDGPLRLLQQKERPQQRHATLKGRRRSNWSKQKRFLPLPKQNEAEEAQLLPPHREIPQDGRAAAHSPTPHSDAHTPAASPNAAATSNFPRNTLMPRPLRAIATAGSGGRGRRRGPQSIGGYCKTPRDAPRPLMG